MIDKKNVEKARLLYYSVLSKLFCFSYDDDRFYGLIDGLKLMLQSPLDSNSEIALRNLVESINEDYSNLSKEYDDIFHAPPNPVRTTISYYDEGYETGVACVAIKRILAKTTIRRDESKYVELEDNFGFIFTIMSKFIEQCIDGNEKYEEYAEELFVNYLNVFIDEFLNAIYLHEKSNFYKDIVNLMVSFFEFERAYYEVTTIESNSAIKVADGLSRSEAARRAKNKARKNKGVQE
ncbi:putative formate dehydrogenase-specific chaperone [Campylobacter blaseri]|uniref:Uncharacterized protein n=1 Tax=Campylobacter blaseri TaxID=2042961 RepID=A0A2P8R473_9BACT|nr:molecular chaperone TorD family protein [Campylobacter blaseri]PSM53298.1 hypothetical protein CQ405_01775 [Campylobacter blaseri]PSM54764.1 hypothetical protein CRN67_01775 [Campylobacter blaseri]QKF86753.1 putative formate dehydrogenase-specific chaperone [Campylobacter blaseri]